MARTVRRGFRLMTCMVGCLWQLRRTLDATSRAAVLSRWSRLALSGIGVEMVFSGTSPASGLIVSNHLSYLDILVFSALTECAFVSKSDVRGWPWIGKAAELSGTVFIERGSALKAATQSAAITQALTELRPVMIFPEGTTTDGSEVKPFKSSLLQPAVDACSDTTAAYIFYTSPNATPARDICYWGDMTLVPHLLHLLSIETITAHVVFADESQCFRDRKLAARSLYATVLRLAGSCEGAEACTSANS